MALNIGIRRAHGAFILSTNLNVLIRPELFQFMFGSLQKEFFYRTASRVDYRFSFGSTVQQVSRWLSLQPPRSMKDRGFEVFAKGCDMTLSEFDFRLVPEKVQSRLYFNNASDFILAHRSVWFAVKGLPELGTRDYN